MHSMITIMLCLVFTTSATSTIHQASILSTTEASPPTVTVGSSTPEKTDNDDGTARLTERHFHSTVATSTNHQLSTFTTQVTTQTSTPSSTPPYSTSSNTGNSNVSIKELCDKHALNGRIK